LHAPISNTTSAAAQTRAVRAAHPVDLAMMYPLIRPRPL
jgi:hypothetical protein